MVDNDSEKTVSQSSSPMNKQGDEAIDTEACGNSEHTMVEDGGAIPDAQELVEKMPEKSENMVACLQVLGAFFLMFNSWGIANTFGAFQVYYESALLKDQTPSNISWIGSIQAFLLLIVGGLVTGPIFDAGHLRGLVMVGSGLAVFGMMMTSICKEYWQVILAQGIIVGAGAGCLLLPSVAVMPQYFTRRKAFATGIAAAGSSIGGVIYPIVFHKLVPRIGFGWATRVIAFIMSFTLLIPILVMRAKVFPSTTRPLFDWHVLRNLPWDLFTIGAFFAFIGMYIPFYYISSYGYDSGIVDENIAFYMLSILNASSVFGRIVPNFFADATGTLNITGPFALFCGIIGFSWLSVSSLAQLVIFCFFYGFFSGTFVSITGPAIFSLSPDLRLVGTHMGMSYGFASFGLVIGTPVAGALLDRYGWLGPAMCCGAANVIAAICIFAARVKKTGWRLRAKA